MEKGRRSSAQQEKMNWEDDGGCVSVCVLLTAGIWSCWPAALLCC